EDDNVEFVFLASRSDALFGNFLDPAVGIGIDKEHVILVKSVVIVGFERRSLRPTGIPLGGQFFGDNRVFYDFADLAPYVIGAQIIRRLVQSHVLVVSQPKGKATRVPHAVEFALALFGSDFQSRFRNGTKLKAGKRITDAFNHAVIIGFSRLDAFGVHF